MLHQSFAAAFLNAYGLPQRLAPRLVPGRGKAGVFDQFQAEVQSLLKQGAETHLLVIVDADGDSFAAVENRLLSKLSPGERAHLAALGRFHLICPNYELENWGRNIEGQQVTEARDLALAYRQNSDCRSAARALANSCRSQQPIPNALPSLIDACGRWQAYKQAHGL